MAGKPDNSAIEAQEAQLRQQREEAEQRAQLEAQDRQEEFLAGRRRQRGRLSLISGLEGLGARVRGTGSR